MIKLIKTNYLQYYTYSKHSESHTRIVLFNVIEATVQKFSTKQAIPYTSLSFLSKQVELVQNLINGVHTLIKLERSLESGEAIDKLIKQAEAYKKNAEKHESPQVVAPVQACTDVPTVVRRNSTILLLIYLKGTIHRNI